MRTKILLTSFQTWLPHQKTNSSDDLLAKIQQFDHSKYLSLFFLRNLPVNIELASQQVIAEIERIEPDVVVSCGMAENRFKLTIESNASCKNECLYTAINLAELIQKLIATEVSHDAGKFVCEGLYYQILKYIKSQPAKIDCIFIHVPLLDRSRLNLILRDFNYILFWLKSQFT